jgi:peptide-methionine (S)-S-oxide reductase
VVESAGDLRNTIQATMKSALYVSTILALFALGKGTVMNAAETKPGSTQLATLGGGCFWCLEALYETFDGVKAVTSGYAGGHKADPTYKQVCSETTGHAEVVQIEYDPAKMTYEQILDIFWEIHDPTTLNRQDRDVGTQYRSVIMYHDDAQKKAAEKSKNAAASKFKDKIVTEIVPLKKYYLAEDYHQDYFRKNPNVPYCAYVISPKLQKLQKSRKKG